MLDEEELVLAYHLSDILENDELDAGLFVATILPVYFEVEGDRARTLRPDPIYRPLYYVHVYADKQDFGGYSRIFMDMASAHIEGCLKWLTPNPPEYRSGGGPFGTLVVALHKAGILGAELSEYLRDFNASVNVPSKHFAADFLDRSYLDKRTFSVDDAALSLIMARKLSVQLFDLLVARGVSLPQLWPPFKQEWLSWSPKITPREGKAAGRLQRSKDFD